MAAVRKTESLLQCTLLGWRARDTALHQKFRGEHPANCVTPTRIYATFIFVMSGTLALSTWSCQMGELPLFYLAPWVVSVLMGAATCFTRTKPHIELLLTIAVSLLVVWSSVMFNLNVAAYFDYYTAGTAATDFSEIQLKHVHELTKEMVSFIAIAQHLAWQIPHFLIMVYLSADQLLVLLSLASFACSMLLSPHMPRKCCPYALLMTTIVSAFFLLTSWWLKRVMLLHYLARAEVEMTFEASQKADSILNHSLKNRMADGAGEIELFLGSYTGPHQPLSKCIASLHRGMQMCQHRQLYLKMMKGNYEPRRLPCNLHDFGTALASGRRLVHTMFARLCARFDSIACEMILENALSNALKHGCPEDPRISFTISSDGPSTGSGDGDEVRLCFCVTNRPHPDRPPLTDDFIKGLVAGNVSGPEKYVPLSGRSEQIGLSHCFAIARACGFSLSLTQEDDAVVFKVGVVADTKTDGNRTRSLLDIAQAPRPLPTGLCFHVLDDSAVARRLVAHHLQVSAVKKNRVSHGGGVGGGGWPTMDMCMGRCPWCVHVVPQIPYLLPPAAPAAVTTTATATVTVTAIRSNSE